MHEGLQFSLISQLGVNISGQLFHLTVTIDHFTVVGLVTWPLNSSEAGVDHLTAFIMQIKLFLR